MKKSVMKKSVHIFMYGLLGAAILMGGCSTKKSDAANAETAKAKVEKPAVKVEQPVGSARVTPIVTAAKKVGPAVVGITTKSVKREVVPNFDDLFDFFANPFKMPNPRGGGATTRDRIVEGVGSGVIYDAKNGYIATNNHVVENATEINVALTDGKTVKGKVLGTDPMTDLAVVKIETKDLPEAPLGDSSTLQVGEPAIAIGNPLGMEFRGSVTVGIISALNRSVKVGENSYTVIQTDAAINPGNSGGALVNADGEVVGINSIKIAANGVEGIGFAIPINTAKPILDQLVKGGTVARPYLGVMLMDKQLADRKGFDSDLHGGILLTRVMEGSPAYNAGLRQYDIILEFNGKKVETAEALKQAVNSCKVGDSVQVKIFRSGMDLTKTIKMAEMPKDFGK